MGKLNSIVKKTYHFFFPEGTERRKRVSSFLEKRDIRRNGQWAITSDVEMHDLIKKRKKAVKHGRFFDSESERISKLKDRHRGERCFIVCTGPSLTVDDLNKLGNEYTFAVNSIIDAYPKTDWRPTYYCVVDCYSFSDALRSREVYGGVYAKEESFFHYRINALHQRPTDFHLPVNYINHSIKKLKRNETELSSDPSICVYDAFTVAAMAFQIAVYMGFKEIYFLGADNSYTKDSRHFLESAMNDSQLGITDFSDIVRLAKKGFSACKEYAEKNGIKLYNATRGGALDIIERVDLDKILQREI